MALVTSHHTRDNLTVQNAHQKQLGSDAKLSLNISMRIIPRPNQVTSPPKCHHGFLIFRLKGADLHRRFQSNSLYQ
jgi:hypothetical protein